MLSLCLLVGACGGSQTSGTVPRSALDAQDRELAALRARAETQDERIRELEGMLALSRADARDLRDATADAAVATAVPAVRIGAPEGEPEPFPEWDEPDPGDDGPRPILRLYGTPRPELPTMPLVIPEAPPGVPDRLMVAPLPGEASVAPAALAAAPPAPAPAAAPDPAERTYREALALVRDRAFARAESALTSLLERHAAHGRAVDARYWRGVVRYALRSYPGAVADFAAVVSRHPRSERAPEALLKMAICHERMGDAGRARSLYQRVRSEYPNSVAARVASQEDAS